jgi:deoxyadenosine/deoxycytidine kinase
MMQMKGSLFHHENIIMVSLSGVPGAGKSTAIKELQKARILERILEERGSAAHMHVVYVLEPSDEWKRNGWLDLFYADPDKNALAFQMIVYKSHKAAVKRAIKAARQDWPEKRILCVTERSVWDQLLFWKLQCDMKRASAGPLDDIAYMAIWNDWSETMPDVNHIFFCKTSTVQQSMQRLKRRELLGSSLDEEGASAFSPSFYPIVLADGVPLAYQELLLTKHEQWFTAGRAHPPHAPESGIPCTHLNMDCKLHNNEFALLQLGINILEAIQLLLLLDAK